MDGLGCLKFFFSFFLSFFSPFSTSFSGSSFFCVFLYEQKHVRLRPPGAEKDQTFFFKKVSFNFSDVKSRESIYVCIIVLYMYNTSTIPEKQRKKEKKAFYLSLYIEMTICSSRGGEVRDGFAAAFYLWLTTYSHSSRESKNRSHLLYILDLGLFLLRYIHAQKVSIGRCISHTKKNLVKRQKNLSVFANWCKIRRACFIPKQR